MSILKFLLSMYHCMIMFQVPKSDSKLSDAVVPSDEDDKDADEDDDDKDDDDKDADAEEQTAEEQGPAPTKTMDKRKVENPLQVLKESLVSTEDAVRKIDTAYRLRFESVQDGVQELKIIDSANNKNIKTGLAIAYIAGQCLQRLKQINQEQGSNFTELVNRLAREGLKKYSYGYSNFLILYFKFCDEYPKILDTTKNIGWLRVNFSQIQKQICNSDQAQKFWKGQ